MARHIRQYHNNNMDVLKFCGVERVSLGPRGGNLDKKIVANRGQMDLQVKYNGLNEGFSYVAFIEGGIKDYRRQYKSH